MPVTVSSPERYQGASPLYWRDRCIGELVGGTWRKSIDSRKHWCRKHDAPGIQAVVFDRLYREGQVGRIEVYDRRSDCTYSLGADDFARYAVRDTLNAEAGEQLFVPRERWLCEGQQSLWTAR